MKEILTETQNKNHDTVAVSGHPNPTHSPGVPGGGGIETHNRIEPLRSALRSCFVNVMVTIHVHTNSRSCSEDGLHSSTGNIYLPHPIVFDTFPNI